MQVNPQCTEADPPLLQLHLTPAETARLRQVSYERQLARGFKRPGYTGTGAARLGDAGPYKPAQSEIAVLEEGGQKHMQAGVSTLRGSDEAASGSQV